MKISTCLLQFDNPRILDGVSIGERVVAQGKQHLWDERPASTIIDTVVIHAMCAVKVDPQRLFDQDLVIRLFCDLGVSSHYLIDRDGEVINLVPEDKKAWHCGGSIMPPPDLRTAVNTFSIGIELIASVESGYTDAQYESINNLSFEIEDRHGKAMRYVGHEDIAGAIAVRMGLRSEAKTDPGQLFEWGRLNGRSHFCCGTNGTACVI